MKLKAVETLQTVSGKTPLTKNKSYECSLLKKTQNGYVQTENFNEAYFVITTDNDGYTKTYKTFRFSKKEIWNLEDLKNDLWNKVPKGSYFYNRLLPKDTKVYHRRTFGDLLEYYKQYGVTEKMLITALDKLQFRTYYCNTPKGMVFFGRGSDYKLKKQLELHFHYNSKIVTKYTATYLHDLLLS